MSSTVAHIKGCANTAAGAAKQVIGHLIGLAHSWRTVPARKKLAARDMSGHRSVGLPVL